MSRRVLPVLAAAILGLPALAGTFDIPWYTIDGGGGTSSGGVYELSGTIGQHDAGVMSGGSFSLTGGFWAGIRAAGLRGDMNCDGVITNFDIDPFVLALVDAAAYQLAFPNCSIMNGDINNDGQFNNFDIDPFVVCIINLGCP
ncbi:MAG: hypothetical protein HRU75_06145 [Planctomycetia bacterium]|nr:MAG: hypothetical protein HRU75_06145 [Planctomycetia bacterium]